MLFLLAAVGLFAAACGSTAQTSTTPPGPVTTFEAQVARGQSLYADRCAGCHGDAGEGDNAAAVVGLDKGALPLDPPAGAKLRTMPFKTAYDVGDFVMKNMPPGGGGSLSQDDYLAILAFDLSANGIKVDGLLDLEKAKPLEIPRKK